MTTTKSDEPQDRLTRLCQAGIRGIEAAEEYTENIKGIIMLEDGDCGGIAITGYSEDSGREAFIDMLVHLQAIAEVNGLKLNFVGIPDSPEGIDDA